MNKKKNLAGRLEKMVRHNNAPGSLEEFLNEHPKQDEERPNNSISESIVDINVKYKREEFRFPAYLAEKLRQASYKLNKKKTEIVQEAVIEYLGRIEQ